MHNFPAKAIQYVAVAATADASNTIIPAPGPNKVILVLNYGLRVVGAGAAAVFSTGPGTVLSMFGAVDPGTWYEAAGNDQDTGVFVGGTNQPITILNGAGIDT